MFTFSSPENARRDRGFFMLLGDMPGLPSFKKLERIAWEAVTREQFSKAHSYNRKQLAEILQGGTLSLVTFSVYLADLDDEVESTFSTFAAVTNLVEQQSK